LRPQPSPTAFGNQTISIRETHGFASLFRNRFAFIGCNRHSAKDQDHHFVVAIYNEIKQYLAWFVNTSLFALESLGFWLAQLAPP
jgi:hypothetical protein